MNVHTVQLSSGSAHWYEVGDSGPPLHFYHANGFPFRTYTEFVNELATDFQVMGLAHRATWKNIGLPSRDTGWMAYADDLIAFLEASGRYPVIGVGHSLGATATLFAASKRPDLFRALVLIEPIFFPTGFLLAALSIPVRARRLFPIVRKALERPERWRSVQEFVEFHRGRRAFSRFTEASLENYGAHGLTPDAGGAFRLAFPKAWEAHVFSTPPHAWRRLKALTVPVLGVRAELSDFVSKASWDKWRGLRKQDAFVVLPGVGHLAPLEAPRKTAHVVADWLHSRPGN
jgi:pimeloyl-ACP methyl ester carboxylesterase